MSARRKQSTKKLDNTTNPSQLKFEVSCSQPMPRKLKLILALTALLAIGNIIAWGALALRANPSPTMDSSTPPTITTGTDTPDLDAAQAPSAPTQTPASATDRGPEAPLRPFKVVNAHEHLFLREHLDKYRLAAQKTGIVKTLFVGSSDFTLKGGKFSPQTGNDENNAIILNAAQELPGEIVPFGTIHPADPGKLEKIKAFVAQGARGLKLYTGHGNFWDRPLDAEEMLPVYAYCQETRLPICWHVNYTKYAEELNRVMAQFPNLIVIVPHFGVTFFRPGSDDWNAFDKLMDTYPEVYTDTSFGTREIMVQGLEAISRNPEPFRAFINKHSDRILWGTDLVVSGNKEKTAEWIESVLLACRDVLEKDAYYCMLAATGSPYAYAPAKNTYGRLRGLALPDDLLRKIYETNFAQLFPN